MDYQGKKQITLLVDDCGPTTFAWLEANPTAASIWDCPTFAVYKHIHDETGACWQLNCFLRKTDDSYDMSRTPTKAAWQTEFQAAAGWMKFSFHSIDQSITNYATQYTNGVVPMKAEILRITGSLACWTLGRLCTHYLKGESSQISQMIANEGTWGGFCWMRGDAVSYTNLYHLTGADQTAARDALAATEIYQEPYLGLYLTPWDSYPDTGLLSYANFAAQLASVPSWSLPLFTAITHEHYVLTAAHQQWMRDAATWATANGYIHSFPTLSDLLEVYVGTNWGGILADVSGKGPSISATERIVLVDDTDPNASPVHYVTEGARPGIPATVKRFRRYQ